MKLRILTSLAAVAVLAACQSEPTVEYEIQSVDAHRFAAIFEATEGTPTADDLRAGYLDGAGRGVEIFTPHRIRDAQHLASVIAARPELYRRGIDVCLPLADDSNDELNRIYAGLKEIFPEETLPDIHVVFGAGNSGGTADADAQVLGLEVICAIEDNEADIRARYRHMFAHETVHAFQVHSPAATEIDPLIAYSIREGFPDYIAWRVTGVAPDAERDSWAQENADMLWRRFSEDRATLNAAIANGTPYAQASDEMQITMRNWYANYRAAPEGWPYEMGYWMGRQIVTAYMDNADDEAEAIATLLTFEDPLEILDQSGFAERASLTAE